MSEQVDTFLVELGTEELPPLRLRTLSVAFSNALEKQLDQAQLAHGAVQACASPRRLAVRVAALAAKQPEQQIERFGPAVAAAFDADGNPTPAAAGFARSCGVALEALLQEDTDKGLRLCFRALQPGKTVAELLPELVAGALKQLPIARPMFWGECASSFVRPVHWLVMLYGKEIVPATIMGARAGRETFGHRFLHPGALPLAAADDYADTLSKKGCVIVDHDARKARVREQLESVAKPLGKAHIEDALLEEVTGLVEQPTTLVAQFEEQFLTLPPEVLISVMRKHQKCFPIFDKNGAMTSRFLLVSNIPSQSPEAVIVGNERVMRARLSDAAFFYQADQKKQLDHWIEGLDAVVFQSKLGSLGDKVRRITSLADTIAQQVGADATTTQRAAHLSKADLLTQVVNEFPALQGCMGAYYARQQGDSEAVACAIREHYLPRFATDALPDTLPGCAVAIADRIDTLVGLFGINKHPTGQKDPFALRRAALGVLRIVLQHKLDIDLQTVIDAAFDLYPKDVLEASMRAPCLSFIVERLNVYFSEQGVAADVLAAVFASPVTQPLDVASRIQAVISFKALSESASLAAANKRVKNILKKSESDTAVDHYAMELLKEPEEKELARLLTEKKEVVGRLCDSNDYQRALEELALFQLPVDAFFDHVMVNADDEAIKRNRVALLKQLSELLGRVADISELHI